MMIPLVLLGADKTAAAAAVDSRTLGYYVGPAHEGCGGWWP